MRLAHLACACFALALSACAPATAPVAEAAPEAEALFRQNPQWLGGDAALSVPLGEARTLWLFGDSFIAPPGETRRTHATFVRNSVAVQTGLEPTAAAMQFAWRTERGRPLSFFPEHGERWYWPGHGVRLDDGPLAIFLFEMAAAPGEGLGFRTAGYALALIDNPNAPPEQWNPRIIPAPALPFDATPATAVVVDGDYVVALAIREQGAHAGALARWRSDALAAGDLGGAQWWAGAERGWVETDALGEQGPHFVIDDAGAEASLHWDARIGAFVHVASYGFGATEIGVRTAPALTGPWSAPRMIYRPQESDAPRPFVYAAKAHPELRGGANDLYVTYAANAFDIADIVSEEGQRRLYWPRMVRANVSTLER